MEPSIDDLRRNYKRYSDDQLIQIATTDTSGLRPEAIQVMKDEIKVRGLSDKLIKGIEVQRNQISEKEILEYCDVLRKQPCPICGASTYNLNATIIGSVISFIVMTNYEKQLLIACPDCLAKASKNAMIKSSLLGWWGIPWGVIKTIQSFIFNTKMLRQAHVSEPTTYFKEFVISQIGLIESSKADNKRIQSLLKHLN